MSAADKPSKLRVVGSARRPKPPARWKCRTCGAVFVGGQLGGAFAEYGRPWCDKCTTLSRVWQDRETGYMERQP